MVGWNTESWEKEKVQLFWQLAGGQSFYYKDLPAEQLGLGNSNSVGATARKLVELGCLSRIARGQYDFTQKAKDLIQPFQTLLAPKIETKEEAAATLRILSPAEFQAFRSLNHCKPCDTGPEKHQKDRINEESIDTSAMEDEDRETFLKKMLRLGIFLEIGPGTKGRVIHLNLEKYLELYDKVQIISPVEKKLETLRPLLAEKEKWYGNLNSSMYSLENQVSREEEEVGQLERELASLQKKVDDAKAEKDAKKARLEEIRRTIAESDGEADIERLKKKIAAYEAFSALDDQDKVEYADYLCPKIS